ncbi:hypothetical protein JTB14_037830 [Gonioctena quinquepunctata]|nr:hypothetical protein JTB14_037830 [Gonioctena quinquepunctata]
MLIIKIFLEVRNALECDKLRRDLEKFETYCSENKFFVNSDKCHCITFTRNKTVSVGQYTLNRVGLKRCSQVRDLGVTYDSELIFDIHINKVMNKSLKMLGYITRQTQFISNPQAILALYYVYVCSKLNFASSIWNPQYNVYVEKLENVQNTFLKYLSSKLRTPTSVAPICDDFKILSLENRRIMKNVLICIKY